MSKIEVNTIEPQSGTTVTLGASGDTVNIPSGATLDLSNATQTGVGGVNTPAFMAYLDGDVTITDATSTKVPFNQKEFDTANAFDNTTNYRFTVPTGQGGKYFIHYNATGSTDPSRLQYVVTQLYKNGLVVAQNWTDTRNAGFGLQFSVGNQLHLNLSAGDYLEVYIIVDPEGSGLYTAKIEAMSVYTTVFGGHKIIE